MVRVDSRTGDAGQLLLVGAIGLGVLFVVLAVILNAAVYTETLAAHDERLGEEQTVRQTQYEANRSLGELVGYVNYYNNTTRAALDENLTAGVADWNRLTGSQLADESATAWVSIRSRSYRTDVVHNESGRTFTDRNLERNWTLVQSTTNTTEFRMNVSHESLYQVDNETCQPSTGCFYLEVTDGSETWRMFVYAPENTSMMSARIVNGDGTNTTCGPAAGNYTWINVTAGQFAGSSCSALSFGEGVSEPYEINYRYGDNATGTYRLTVNTSVYDDPYYATRSPYLDPTITGVTADFGYRSADLNYTTDLRVKPGGRDG